MTGIGWFSTRESLKPSHLGRRSDDLVTGSCTEVGTDGKLQKLSVRESPDVRFNRPIIAALNHWSFRPAQLNGQAVALKVLIGIPILPFE